MELCGTKGALIYDMLHPSDVSDTYRVGAVRKVQFNDSRGALGTCYNGVCSCISGSAPSGGTESLCFAA